MVLVGYTRKPFGLTGEMKVKPESFDLNRHEQLKEVVFQKTQNSKKVKYYMVDYLYYICFVVAFP